MLYLEQSTHKTDDHENSSFLGEKAEIEVKLEKPSEPICLAQNQRADFWKLWLHYQNYLYQRCLTWMGGNQTDAEDALSRASIKAWEKWQDYGENIVNTKAWMTRLTYNLCMDMHRERIKMVKIIAEVEDMVDSNVPSPELSLLESERDGYIRSAIGTLPAKLRTPFILRHYQDMSYQEIAQQLALTTDNIRKRVQLGRSILQQQLNKYFSGENNFFLPPLNASSKHLQEGKATDQEDFSATFIRGLEESSTLETLTKLECIPGKINYRVTATCLETLSHAWSSSPTLLEWI